MSMSYDDYRSRKWRVTSADAASLCQVDQFITFDGPEEAVIVHCQRTPRYGEGRYWPPPAHTIMRDQEYTISMIAGDPSQGQPSQIRFEPQLPRGERTGSWTASDHEPWRGDA